ncbi:thiol-disulfide oxidoreductase [[Pantoea] beijingensis]|uniref:Thiol-disulfide oxidoreductase n=1 Tax=[Pantoea] beijingensis TaxID=1324864 RepID=A0A443IHE0_9GAMM|nr:MULTISPECIES: thiol-disulfide oxidoreductase DCC family protein [Erwiniaceae]RWR03422.1 thiol-disulfide oxidoreductase [[Pantoea] beijingensis]
MSQPPWLQSGDRAVIYDGVCRLCNGWVNFLIRHDRYHSVRLAAVQSVEGEALLNWAGLAANNVKTIVLIDDGRVFLRAEAIFRVMKGLPWPWRVLGVLRFLPAALSNRCYDLIALNRYRLFGRYDSCRCLEADHPQRVIQSKKTPP